MRNPQLFQLHDTTSRAKGRRCPCVLSTSIRPSKACLHGYFDACRATMPSLLEFYGAMRYRGRRWRSFQKEQRSIHRLIAELRKHADQRHDGVGVRLGRAISNLKTHGVAPCINMGLHRRLSKHFLVADTPAHYTSRTCSNVQKCLVVFGSVRGTWA